MPLSLEHLPCCRWTFLLGRICQSKQACPPSPSSPPSPETPSPCACGRGTPHGSSRISRIPDPTNPGKMCSGGCQSPQGLHRQGCNHVTIHYPPQAPSQQRLCNGITSGAAHHPKPHPVSRDCNGACVHHLRGCTPPQAPPSQQRLCNGAWINHLRGCTPPQAPPSQQRLCNGAWINHLRGCTSNYAIVWIHVESLVLSQYTMVLISQRVPPDCL